MTVARGGILDLGGGSETVYSVLLRTGAVRNGTLLAPFFDVASGTVSADLAGSGGLHKATAGTVVLSGTNTYTGGTLVSGGVLQVDDSGALPAGGLLKIAGGNVVLTAGLGRAIELGGLSIAIDAGVGGVPQSPALRICRSLNRPSLRRLSTWPPRARAIRWICCRPARPWSRRHRCPWLPSWGLSRFLWQEATKMGLSPSGRELTQKSKQGRVLPLEIGEGISGRLFQSAFSENAIVSLGDSLAQPQSPRRTRLALAPAVRPAAARDAALRSLAARQSVGEFAWLSDMERITARKRTEQKSDASRAVDEVFAAFQP